MLPLMLSVIEDFRDHQFVVAAAPALPETFYKEITGRNCFVVADQTHELPPGFIGGQDLPRARPRPWCERLERARRPG